jgi:hypothetical protein
MNKKALVTLSITFVVNKTTKKLGCEYLCFLRYSKNFGDPFDNL